MAKRPPIDPHDSAPSTPAPTQILPADQDTPTDLREVLPAHEQHAPGVELFLDACLVYGIDPSADAAPIEIPDPVNPSEPRWKHYPTNPRQLHPQPERIAFVTAGGLKIVHPLNDECERILRRWLQAYHIDPKTRELVEDPLPEDKTLPRQAITGEVLSAKHQYREGYMRARQDAARRS